MSKSRKTWLRSFIPCLIYDALEDTYSFLAWYMMHWKILIHSLLYIWCTGRYFLNWNWTGVQWIIIIPGCIIARRYFLLHCSKNIPICDDVIRFSCKKTEEYRCENNFQVRYHKLVINKSVGQLWKLSVVVQNKDTEVAMRVSFEIRLFDGTK